MRFACQAASAKVHVTMTRSDFENNSKLDPILTTMNTTFFVRPTSTTELYVVKWTLADELGSVTLKNEAKMI